MGLDGLSRDVVDGLARVDFFSLFIEIQDVPVVVDLMIDLPLWRFSHRLQLLSILLRKIQIFPILHRTPSMALLDVLDVDQHLPYHRGLLGLAHVATGLLIVAIFHVEAF